MNIFVLTTVVAQVLPEREISIFRDMKLRIRLDILVGALVLLLMLAGIVLAHGDGRAGIEESVRRWEAAVRTGDPAAVAALYTEEARLLPPNSDFVVGRPAIEAFFQSVLAAGVQEIRTESVEITTQGHLGLRVARFVTLGEDGRVLDRGKALEVWRKVNGTWLFQEDCWNSSMPAPGSSSDVGPAR